MIALKELWRQQRLQRHQEIAQRQQDITLYQQEVRDHLAKLQQERLANTTELRDSLKQFQLSLQHQTQTYLDHISDQRRQQAQALVSSLRQFAEALQVQTQQFLSLTHADRQLRAEALVRTLHLFHQNLSILGENLRNQFQREIQDLREEVQTICAETQMYLSSREQERIREHIQLAETLSAYVQTLQTEVETYLAQLNQLGQERAQDLQRQFLDQRQARATEMNDLFEDLAIFRGELREYCANLYAMIWGDASTDGGQTPVAPPVVPKASPPVRSSTPAPTRTNKRTPAPSAIPASVRNGGAPATAPVAAPPKPVAGTAPPVPAPSPVPSHAATTSTEPPPAMATPDTSIDTFADSVPEGDSNGNPTRGMSWGTASVAPPRKEVADVEHDIVNYLQSGEGARLTEIESALDINRFQAVDALRSLIKQGRVIQRDRVYIVQEESIL